jgi:hypothetical protein
MQFKLNFVIFDRILRYFLFTNLFVSSIFRTKMNTWFKVISVIVIGLCAIQLRTTSATGNEDGDEDDEKHPVKNLTIAWIENPPYTTSPTNGSVDDEAHGMLRDVLLRYITIECGYYAEVSYEVKTFRAENEFHMIELLRQNKVHVAAPIFESTNRRYGKFSFFKITDYPGSQFITSEGEGNKLSLVLDAVLKSWSLFAVTLILTAIAAGVIMWALVCLTLCT